MGGIIGDLSLECHRAVLLVGEMSLPSLKEEGD